MSQLEARLEGFPAIVESLYCTTEISEAQFWCFLYILYYEIFEVSAAQFSAKLSSQGSPFPDQGAIPYTSRRISLAYMRLQNLLVYWCENTQSHW
jgi:hypothetical protein